MGQAGSWYTQLFQLPLRNKPIFVPLSRLVIPANHFPEFVGRQADTARHASRQPLAQQPLGQPIIFGLPLLTDVEQLLQRVDALAGATQFLAGVHPAR